MASSRTSGHAGGARGAAATAHPAATAAARDLLASGGNAVDAAVGAQAVICVVMPNAAGLGGDMLALVHQDGEVSAVNGTGASAGNQTLGAATGGSSVTVPGLVDGWLTMHRRWGRLPLGAVLEGAVQLARNGVPVDEHLATAVSNQRDRLDAGGAGSWSLLASQVGTRWRQPPLATLLEDVARRGADAFYAGAAADAMVAAVRRCGGSLSLEDLDSHETPCPSPVAVPWQGGVVHVQPPMSQGVLLAMALQEVGELAAAGVGIDDHVLVEVTEAAFAHRASCARGSELLAEKLTVDLHRAGGRGGPRAYLHTAGVAVADADGLVVSSLVSVFDDFGSGVFVPELGIVLNNRAAGFTDGANGPGPGKRPVHTLAPAIVTSGHEVLAIATPGADGQVQTLLQVLTATALQGRTLAEAVSFPRWRSEDGDLLVEPDHPSSDDLVSRGHRVVEREAGADVFGAVVAAGVEVEADSAHVPASPFAVADWRRQATCGGVA